MKIDLEPVPFSLPGAWLGLSRLPATVSAPWAEHKSTAVPVTPGENATPWHTIRTELFVAVPPSPAVPPRLSRTLEFAGDVTRTSILTPPGHLNREGIRIS